jgi:hypothetical protein
MNLVLCSEHLEGSALNKNITRILSHHWKTPLFPIFSPDVISPLFTVCLEAYSSLGTDTSCHDLLFIGIFIVFLIKQTWNCVLSYAVFAPLKLFTIIPPICCYLPCDLHGW